MNYIFYSIVVFSLSGLLILPLWFKYRLKLDFYSKQILRKAVTKEYPFFSSYALRESVKIALRQHLSRLLDYLFNCQFSKASDLLADKNKLLSVLLKGFSSPAGAVRQLQSLVKKNPKNAEIACWLALLLEKTEKKDKVQVAWDNVSSQKLSPYLKAYYLSHLAQSALRNGDLEFASRCFYRALALFDKSKAFYEEGFLYLQLGTVYRISFLDDIADTLFRSALKIFTSLDFKKGIAKTYANLGLLMTGQERFNEAESYFNKAFELYTSLKKIKESAEVQNQQALLALLQNDYSASEKLLQQAKKKHSEIKNTQGIAFSTELSANCHWVLKNFEKTISLAQKAVRLYRRCDNVSGLLDSLYLQAQALFQSGDDVASESVIRDILSIGKKDCGCFYLANAYTLLGVIFMKRKDYQRARGLFQQSLDLEQRGVRLNALAVDYANIGLAELSRGSKETALKNLKTALDFAHQTEDENLCSQIQKQIDAFNN